VNAETQIRYMAFVAQVQTAWAALEDVAAGVTLSPRLVAAIATAKSRFMAPEYDAERQRVLKALLAGEPPGISLEQWATESIGRLSTMLAVAERGLEAAKERAVDGHAAAWRDLATQLLTLLAASGFAGLCMLAVSRRVIRPLHAIRDAMLKLAAG